MVRDRPDADEDMLVQVIGLKDLSAPLDSERETCEQSQVEQTVEDGRRTSCLRGSAWARMGTAQFAGRSRSKSRPTRLKASARLARLRTRTDSAQPI